MTKKKLNENLLMPCVFCGEEVKLYKDFKEAEHFAGVECKKCHCKFLFSEICGTNKGRLDFYGFHIMKAYNKAASGLE
jgi:hypothetical protein